MRRKGIGVFQERARVRKVLKGKERSFLQERKSVDLADGERVAAEKSEK